MNGWNIEWMDDDDWINVWWMDEWMKWMNERGLINGMDGWMNEILRMNDDWMDGWIRKWMNEILNEWMDG